MQARSGAAISNKAGPDIHKMAKNKISIVRYLNAVPLAWGILDGPQKDIFDTVLNTPAECADQLSNRHVDIGLIPSIEFQRIKGCRIVPGPTVASMNRVRSVILVSVVPLWKVRTVACDNGSRTSVALAKIIFSEFYHIHPDFRPAEPDLANMLAQSDAALLIGDNALKFMETNERPNIEVQKALVRLGSEPLQVFDLAERWRFLTGLPFVFAFWAVREGFNDPHVVDTLKQSRDFGVANIPAIAERYSEPLQIKKEFVLEYLEQNVHYYMDSHCLDALQLFYEKAAQVGAIKNVRALQFA
jgi:chorismate dehydratase